MKLLVVGGNGFVGSSVVKHAVKRGWDVVSVSSSGRPFETKEGFSPSWTRRVEWRKGSPFEPATIADVLPSCTAAVSTLGILLETDYKSNKQPTLFGLLRGALAHATGDRGNPLARSSKHLKTYERINKDAVLSLLDAVIASRQPSNEQLQFPFVYLSAEDIFRPWIPFRYIATKREAERLIQARLAALKQSSIRPVFVRPSLIYHPHQRPLTTLPASVLEASAHVHRLINGDSARDGPAMIENASSSEPGSALQSLQSLLSVPPVHVDAVGEVVCRSLEDRAVEGVVDVARMRQLLARQAFNIEHVI
ncbi:hypothetical protein ACM66B_004831 [Microbotryomycetes sp. NB124-2]